jgi:hypothetical protein
MVTDSGHHDAIQLFLSLIDTLEVCQSVDHSKIHRFDATVESNFVKLTRP